MRKILFILSFVLCLCAYGQGYHLGVNKSVAIKGKVENGYNFWLYSPDSLQASEKKPLIIFLHGKSLSGTDMNRVLRYGTIKAINKYHLAIDAYVIAPQTTNGWNPDKIMNIVNWMKTNCNIDTTRIYALGMSMGGYGTADLCAAYPDKIAAGIEICGGCSRRDVSGLSKLPFWIFHGTADRAVVYNTATTLSEKIKQNGDSRLLFTKLKGYNHGQPERIFNIIETYDWLMSHSLTDEDRPVNKDYYDVITVEKLTFKANSNYTR